jgi:hypothetical protein
VHIPRSWRACFSTYVCYDHDDGMVWQHAGTKGIFDVRKDILACYSNKNSLHVFKSLDFFLENLTRVTWHISLSYPYLLPITLCSRSLPYRFGLRSGFVLNR